MSMQNAVIIDNISVKDVITLAPDTDCKRTVT
jgi:hypothetical protein